METSGPAKNSGGPAATIALIEDHQLISASLKTALEAEGFSVVVPALSEPAEVARALAADPPTVALLDLDLGAFGSGESLLPLLVDLRSRVLIVSGTADDADIGRCLLGGAWGWVPKSADFDELRKSILLAVSGRPLVGDQERDRLLRAWRENREATEEAMVPFRSLSPREAAVLGMLQDGKSVERIAAESFVSEATVRTQVRAILSKLGVNSQLEAVAKAARIPWRTYLEG